MTLLAIAQIAAALVIALQGAVTMSGVWPSNGDPPTPDAVVRAAASASSRGGAETCEELHRKLAGLPAIGTDEAWRRIKARQPGDTAPLDLRFANLVGAKLDDQSLQSALLQFANLTDASIVRTKFSDATMSCADLSGATGKAAFRSAVLDGASLADADLRESNFEGAFLSGADLTEARLDGADLSGADLTGASLAATELDRANLTRADLRFADYRAFGAPRASAALHLPWLFPRDDALAGMSALRKSLIDAGDRDLARHMTYSIEAWRDHFNSSDSASYPWLTWIMQRLKVLLRRLAFDFTVKYGLRPMHAVTLWLRTGLMFAAGYFLLLTSTRRNLASQLVVVEPKGGMRLEATVLVEGADSRILPVGLSPGAALRAALCFSMLSASRFGYGSLALSSWLAAMQPREREYRALGLMRVLSGLQALASFYLLVLFAVCVLGDPFLSWP